MARAKAKGKNPRKKTKKLADRISRLKSIKQEEKVNPFEIKINRQKNKVIGQKNKHDKGLPGVSRAKAMKKRKETLLQEYKKRNKTNFLIDRRIGENDTEMSLEEKMSARFTAERQIAEEKKMRKGKKIFNLNDEEELTHYGQSLAEIERFDDPRSDDDSEEEKLAQDFLTQTSFGGGLFTKKDNENENLTGNIYHEKTREEKIDEMIALSKLKKLERQNQREDLYSLTEKLDSEWKDVRSLLNLNPDSTTSALPPSTEPTSYDMLVKSLKYEARGKPLDRLKTEEELAVEEKKKLEKLEADRLARMHGNDENQVKFNHISADDLNDNFDLGKKKQKILLYDKNGRLIEDEDEEEKEEEDDNSLLEVDNENSSNQSTDNSDNENEDNFSDIESDEEDRSEEKEFDEEERSEEEEEKSAAEDNETVSKNLRKKETHKSPKTKLKNSEEKEILKKMNIPKTLDEFKKITEGHSASNQALIIERIIKNNQQQLKSDNNEKLEVFYDLLLEYIEYITCPDSRNLDVLDKLIPFLYDLTQMAPTNAANCVLKFIKKKRALYIKNSMQYLTGIQSIFPDLDTILLFQMVSILFPTSDFRHKVVTPAALFMGQILTECRPNSRQDIAKGLCLSSIFFDYVSLSKRLVPEVLNYLFGILSLAVNCSELEKSSLVILPFKSSMKATLMLDSPEITKNMTLHPFKLCDLTDTEGFTDEFRVNAVWICCDLLLKFAQLYQDLPSFKELFKPLLVCTKKLPLSHYPHQVKDTIESVNAMLRTRHLLTPLMRARKRPQSIKLFEPKIEADFTGRKSKKKSSQSSESERLKHVVKRETKGALRELRRDNQFLAQHQLQEQIERDTERKRKVKELYSALSNQEGDYKSLMRKKKKK